MPNKRTFVIGYDIKDPSRLQKVHRKLCAFAVPIQLSVFLLTGSDADIQSCISAVTPLIDDKEDDVRFYRLPIKGFAKMLGKAVFPDGLFFSDMPTSF